ncbi:hypothetical protein BC827DRAFT_1164266 [Russula dissimulans]|nr:hypothetical protein BC827DRAFT_1164266 [Russula dissimulans]
MSEHETSAAIIETETSTAELAQEVHNRTTQAQVAAREAALIAEAQPHLPSGAVQAGDTTTAARAEAEQPTDEAAQAVHETAEHAKGVAEHAASTAHTRGPGATGRTYDAVTQLRAKVEETTDAAVAEGQRNVQAAAKDLASSAISLRQCSYLPAGLTGGTTEDATAGDNEKDKPSGSVPASSAPLESGSHTLSAPYPASDVHARQVAVNESK